MKEMQPQEARRVAELAPDLAPERRRRRQALYGMAFVPAAFALPLLWMRGAELPEPEGMDLVICLDVSRSMLARDAAPSRLLRAQEEIRLLTARATGDRLALVIFGGVARLEVPLTHDGALLTVLASACLSTLVKASWKIRKNAVLRS